MRMQQILILAGVLTALFAQPGWAITRQQVIVQFDPTPSGNPDPNHSTNSDEDRDDDSIDDGNGGTIDRSITAQIGQKNGNARVTPYYARGSVGEFGELGIEAETIAVGELDSQIFIESDDFQNITGRPQQATARFIIDGGRAGMYAGSGSLLEFTMTVRKNFDVVFQTAFEFEAAAGGSGFGNELTLFGDDIGIERSSTIGVDIPLAFVSADLGIIQPNERFELSYQLDITATIHQYAEIAFFEFSDPFGVDMGGAFTDIVEFSDVQAVPLPATAPVMLGALGVLFTAAKRTRQQPRA